MKIFYRAAAPKSLFIGNVEWIPWKTERNEIGRSPYTNRRTGRPRRETQEIQQSQSTFR